jgi:hypothetical protein
MLIWREQRVKQLTMNFENPSPYPLLTYSSQAAAYLVLAYLNLSFETDLSWVQRKEEYEWVM